MEIPLYQQLGQSDFSKSLSDLGYTHCHAISSSAPNAFYTILALGLTNHFAMRYPCSGFFVKKWADCAPTLNGAFQRYREMGGEMYSNEGFWRELGQGFVTDIVTAFSNKEYIGTVRNGRELDKTVKAPYEAILRHFALALIWYERSQEGEAITNQFVTASQQSAQVYIAIAQEGASYYLLYHRDFHPNSVREGFPFYTHSHIDPAIPRLGLSAGVSNANPEETLRKCVETEAAMILKLVGLLVRYGPEQMPVEAAGDQTELKEMRDRVIALAETCKCPVQLRTAEVEKVLTVTKVADTNVLVRPMTHDCTNCESFPELAIDVYHEGEGFHSQCLAMHIRSLPDTQGPIRCPRCPNLLSDILLSRVVPDIAQRRQLLKESFTQGALTTSAAQHNSSYFGAVAPQQSPNVPPMYPVQHSLIVPPRYAVQQPPASTLQCSQCNNVIVRKLGITMDCGYHLCVTCANILLARSMDTCPCCRQMITFEEKKRLGELYAQTISN